MPTQTVNTNSPFPLYCCWNPLGGVSNVPFDITDTPHMFAHSASSAISQLKKTMPVNTMGVSIICTDGINASLAHLPPPLPASCDDT